MADPVAASGAASPFRAGTVLRPPRPSLLDAVAHSAVLRALAAWRDNGGGQPPLLLDGTAGNGHDCLFLARQAPAGSLLLALDIQEAALQASRARLEQAGMAARCCASAAAACALSPLPSGTTDIRLVLHSHAALPELLQITLESGRTELTVRIGYWGEGSAALARKARDFVGVDADEDTRSIRDWQPTVPVHKAFHEPVYPKNSNHHQEGPSV